MKLSLGVSLGLGLGLGRASLRVGCRGDKHAERGHRLLGRVRRRDVAVANARQSHDRPVQGGAVALGGCAGRESTTSLVVNMNGRSTSLEANGEATITVPSAPILTVCSNTSSILLRGDHHGNAGSGSGSVRVVTRVTIVLFKTIVLGPSCHPRGRI